MSKVKSPFHSPAMVQIVIPERFVRCGYNMTPLIAAEYLAQNHEQDIIDFITKLGITGLIETAYMKDLKCTERLKVKHRMVQKLLGDLGYFYTGVKGFGGSERKIFTVPAPEYTGLFGWITESRSVMTGTHYGPGGDYDDYEPGGLSNMRHNRIHRISVYRPDIHTLDLKHAQFKNELWFEQRCLEVIPE